MNVNTETQKKLRKIIISFLILIIPIGYLFGVADAFDSYEKIMDDTRFSDDRYLLESSIVEIDKLLRIVPWSTAMKESKYDLYFKLGNYRKVLNHALKKNSYGQVAMIYEYLNEPDSAKIYYRKILIEGNADEILDVEENIYDQYSIQRGIALLYTFLEDSIKAKDYLIELSDDLDFDQKKALVRLDYYIENYRTGGYMDFFHGETIFMQNDTLSDDYNTDSLIIANRIMYKSRNFEEDKAEYEFRLIYKSKAEKIGFRQLIN